jgi:sugar phosphate isomerase/epimerase
MAKTVELLAGHWTLAGDTFPMGPTEVSSIPLEQRAAAAAEAGYTGMGLLYQDMMDLKGKIGLSGIKKIFDDNGIRHFEVEFLGDWFEGGEKKAASDRVKKDLLELAAHMGARDMKIAPKMWTEEIDVGHYAEQFAKVCEDARQVGTTVAIEFLPFTNIRSLKVANEIVRQAGQDNGGLCVDIWHVHRGNISYDEVARLPKSYVKSVELNDAGADVVGDLWNDTLHHRKYPGEGVFDPKAFIKAIMATGFDSFWSVEMLNAEYRMLPLKEQAKRSFDTTMAQFEALA